MPVKINRVGNFGHDVSADIQIFCVGREIRFCRFDVKFPVGFNDVFRVDFFGKRVVSVIFPAVFVKFKSFVEIIRAGFAHVGGNQICAVGVHVFGHICDGWSVDFIAVVVYEFIMPVDIPALLVLIVKGSQHETCDVGHFVDIRFILGDWIEARFENTVLRQEDEVALLDCDVIVGHAVIEAKKAGGKTVAHFKMRPRRAVNQSDAARINLIRAEFVFGDGDVQVIWKFVDEQIAPVAQIVGRGTRDFLRNNLLVEKNNFFEDIVDLFNLRLEVFVLQANLLLKFGSRRLQNVADVSALFDDLRPCGRVRGVRRKIHPRLIKFVQRGFNAQIFAVVENRFKLVIVDGHRLVIFLRGIFIAILNVGINISCAFDGLSVDARADHDVPEKACAVFAVSRRKSDGLPGIALGARVGYVVAGRVQRQLVGHDAAHHRI